MGKTREVTKLWLIRCGEGGSVIDSCISNEVVAVRFQAVGDVRERSPEQILEELKTTPDKAAFETLRRDLLMFANDINIGDIVLTPDKVRRRYFIGRITGDYNWLDESPVPNMKHLRNIEWRNFMNWDSVPEEFEKVKRYRRAVLELTDEVVVKTTTEALENQLSKADMLFTSKSWNTKSAAAKGLPPTQERLCVNCGLKKHVGQFDGDANVCVDCD